MERDGERERIKERDSAGETGRGGSNREREGTRSILPLTTLDPERINLNLYYCLEREREGVGEEGELKIKRDS